MTVIDLVDKKQEIERCISNSEKAFSTVCDAFKELETKLPKDHKKLIEPFRAALYMAAQQSGVDQQVMRNYSSMLSDIMRQTEIAWPPACSMLNDSPRT